MLTLRCLSRCLTAVRVLNFLLHTTVRDANIVKNPGCFSFLFGLLLLSLKVLAAACLLRSLLAGENQKLMVALQSKKEEYRTKFKQEMSFTR